MLLLINFLSFFSFSYLVPSSWVPFLMFFNSSCPRVSSDEILSKPWGEVPEGFQGSQRSSLMRWWTSRPGRPWRVGEKASLLILRSWLGPQLGNPKISAVLVCVQALGFYPLSQSLTNLYVWDSWYEVETLGGQKLNWTTSLSPVPLFGYPDALLCMPAPRDWWVLSKFGAGQSCFLTVDPLFSLDSFLLFFLLLLCSRCLSDLVRLPCFHLSW
jgi:hypothetical protein